MVFDSLGESLRNTLKKITNSMFVDEKLINELVKDIQKALIKSDVNIKLVLEITTGMKKRALEEKTPVKLSKKEHLVNIVFEELVNFLGKGEKFEVKQKPHKIMLVGLFGSGKTTTTGKLSSYFKKRAKKVAVITTDTWRPAAFDQLKQISESLKIDFFGDKTIKDPSKIYKKFEKELQKYDLIIIDTAGRDSLSDELITELNKINDAVKPDDTFLVLSADIGQTAQKQAQTFHDNCSVTGIIISKLDGTSKGGGALVACSVTGAPVRFLGVGEKTDDLEEFRPEGFVSRLLGMGDLEALLEKSKEAFSEEEAKDLGKKFLKGEHNLIDLYEQMQSLKKMGPLTKIMDMIPGFNSVPKHLLEDQQQKMEVWKFVMQSMTKKELENPEIINNHRVKRIYEGSGTNEQDVRSLLKQYKQSKKMFKMLKPGSSEKDIQKMMQKMQGKAKF